MRALALLLLLAAACGPGAPPGNASDAGTDEGTCGNPGQVECENAGPYLCKSRLPVAWCPDGGTIPGQVCCPTLDAQ